MENEEKFSLLGNLKNDIPASIIVFLVAVPLCLGIALASGAPLFSGIIAGIVGGIVVGVFSGSPLGVSGPAAGLAVIVLTAIQDLGAFETFLLAVVIAGVFQFLLGVAQAGIIGYYFPSSVIKGMLAGIGVIIFLKQIPHAFGYDHDYEGSLAFQNPDGQNTLTELYYMFGAITPGAVIVASVSLFILILWEQKFMKQFKLAKFIQGPLVAVAAGIGLSLAFRGTSLELAPEHLVAIPVAESLSGFFGQFTFPDFSQITNPQVYTVAITLAIVASLETLLCLEATDKLDPFKRVSPANKELKAQGIGNLVSGLVGGLPVTQVIVRSSTNILSGGRTKMSAILHGFILLGCAAAIPAVLNLIPLACLAAILFVVGYKLAKPVLFKEMWAKGRSSFVPFMVTILGIVFTDLLIGIGIGMVVAIFYILYNNYRVPFLFEKDEHVHGDQTVRIELAEDVSFLNKANIQRALNNIPLNSKVIIDARKSVHIDIDVVEIIEDFKVNAGTKNIEVRFLTPRRNGVPKSQHKELNEALSSIQTPILN
ncbi:MAG: SulP family inorganic anion transporter [Bacteroidia bacterium]|nr:SulP family inorganic anion transporter [Bacteroidia bacterium]